MDVEQDGRKRLCCSSAMTGPRIITTWRCRTRRGGGWPGPAARGGGRDRPVACAARRASRRPGRRVRGRAGGGRDRDRPRAVGAGAGRGRVPGVRGQPAAGGPVPASGTASPGPRATPADAHTLADMVRTDSHQLRAGRRGLRAGRGVKVRRPGAQDADLGTAPGTLLRLRQALREFFPAALEAFDDLTAARRAGAAGQGPGPGHGGPADADPDHRRAASGPAAATSTARAEQIQAALRAEQLAQPPVLAAAYAATVRGRRSRPDRPERRRSRRWKAQVEAHFGQHPDAEIYRQPTRARRRSSAPGCSAEFGDDPHRYADAESPQELRRHQPDHPPASGKKKFVLARYVHNDRLPDALSRRPSAR